MRHLPLFTYKCPKLTCPTLIGTDVPYSEAYCSHGKPVTRFNPWEPLVLVESRVAVAA